MIFPSPSLHRDATVILLAAVLAGMPHVTCANVKMPAIFGDHMVLQQDQTLPVWGTADPGEAVEVSIGGNTGRTTADKEGKWLVKLSPVASGTSAVTMTVTGKNTLTFTDVLPGDVWICSGQSNMAYRLPKDETPQATDSRIRFFTVPLKTAMEPQSDVGGSWVVCTPQTAGDFSSVGYYFARELRATVGHSIGLIGSYWVGSGGHSWVSITGLRKEPSLKFYADAYDRVLAAYPQRSASYAARMAEYQTAQAKWEKESGPAYNEAHQKWYDAVKKAGDAGEPVPGKPQLPPAPPIAPVTPDGGTHTPATIFNGMIAPLIPYAIKGVIWYQGESNHARAMEYQTLLSRLIADWRAQWGEGDFPFLVVQLPNIIYPLQDIPFVRESQLKAVQALPNAGIAVTIDVGDPNNLHPRNKKYVGLRLAQAARHVAYGQDVVYSGPRFESMKIEGNSIRVNFSNTGSGLVIGTAPYLPPHVAPLQVTALVGFMIAGDERKWFSADAMIKGNAVTVSSAQVPHPVAVRYAWEDAPRCNLYNKEGLPASPFRSDDWLPDFRRSDWEAWPAGKGN